MVSAKMWSLMSHEGDNVGARARALTLLKTSKSQEYIGKPKLSDRTDFFFVGTGLIRTLIKVSI